MEAKAVELDLMIKISLMKTLIGFFRKDRDTKKETDITKLKNVWEEKSTKKGKQSEIFFNYRP